MTPTAEQIRIAAAIDAQARHLFGEGHNDAIIFREMSDHMPGFKRLIDGMEGNPSGLDELCERFPSFLRYARIIENISRAIQAGAFSDILR
jgi:hypothetical protein